MILSKIYIRLLSAWKFIVNCYDNSLIGRAIAGICAFFGARCRESIGLSRFKTRFAQTSYVRHSYAAKAISLPFTLLKALHLRFERSIESIKANSILLDFLNNISCLRVCDLGIALLCFGIGGIAALAIKGTALSLGGLLLLVLCMGGIVMLTVKATVRNTLSSSIIVALACKVFFCNAPEYDTSIYDIKYKSLLYIIPALTGAICAYVSLSAMLCALAAAICIILILWKTVIGIYLFVALAAIAPTMALVGIIALTLVSYGLHLAFGKNASHRITPFTIFIAAFLFLAAFSAFTSVKQQSSIPVFMVYFVFTLAFTLIVNNVKTKSQWQSLVAVFALSAFAVAAYGVMQNFFLEQTSQGWVDAEMFEDIKTRVYSTLDNPNVLGQFLILSIPLTLACMLAAKSGFAKLVYCGMLLTGAACLFFTWSRAAWVGVALAIVIMLVRKDKRFLAICVAGILIAPFILPQSILERLTSIGNTNDSSTSYRISVWIASIYMIRDFFLTGVGLGSDAFAHMYRNYALGGASFALHAHNFYLQWIADMGIGGLMVFILIILTCYKGIYSIKSDNPLIKYTGFAISGSIVGYLFQGMAETMWYNYRMILIFWIFMALVETAANAPKGEDTDD